jgi:DNA-binding IclR family transcriptional regulator
MKPSKEKTDRALIYQVRVLDRAIDILDSFTLRRKELSIRDIVDATGLNRSTAIRLVANLERRGLLQRAPTKGRYRLGQRLFEMGGIVRSSFSVIEAAAGPLSALEQRVGATIVLAVRNGEYSVIVDRRRPAEPRGEAPPISPDLGIQMHALRSIMKGVA